MADDADAVKFLLVDDQPAGLDALDALLRRDGLDILRAGSGREALELLLAHADVALALVDVQMPGMDGVELAELMRGTARTRDIPIILLTAGGADAARRFKGYGAGAVDFLGKPADPHEIRQKADVFFRLDRQRRDLRRQRDALLASEARLAMALEGTSDGLWDWDLAAGEVYHSPRWAEMLGHRPGDWDGTHGDWLRHVHPEDAAASEAHLRAYLAGEVAEYKNLFRVRHADGRWIWILSRGKGHRDASGRLVRMVGVHTDVTAQREAEERVRRLNETLERRVAEEVAAREQAQAQLAHARRMEALGQLAGGIAHDFNNVLQAVGGGASLIQRRPDDAEAVRRLARMVADAAARGGNITRRLLAFSRRGDLRTEPVDPAALLLDLREMFAHTLGAGVGVRVEAPEGSPLPAVLADKGQLETVLVNLAANARDAMEGQGVLTLAAAAERVARPREAAHSTPLRAGAYVRLSVADTGAGMPPEVLERLTEPFFTTKEKGKGTGLGLAMARGFAEQSGGALAVESAPGRGTTVLLWLPVADAATEAASAVPPSAGSPEEAPPGPARVLLVDDDAVVRGVLAEQLGALGHRVRAAAGGAEALAALDAGEAVDLVVSDLSMPGMDGVRLVAEIHRRRPRLPAILLTGFATDAAEVAVGGALAGTFSLLRKPVPAEQLAERIAVMLEEVGAAPAGGGRS